MADNKPIISVIMPVKNNEEYFPKAVQSVLNQTFENWELVIVEGNSDDNTGKIADEYADSDDRVVVLHENEWIYESLNIGISRAKGEYVTFLNSDDLLMPGALSKASEFIEKYGVDLFLFAVSTTVCDENQNVLSDDSKEIISLMPNEFVLNNFDECKANWGTIMRIGLLNNQLNVYRKKLIKDLRFRNDIFGADYYFNLQMLPKMNSIGYYPECLYRFNAYQGVKGMNASVGKYYPYKHQMYNDFYYKSIELFATYGCLSPDILKMRRKIRIMEFAAEIDTYQFESCKLPLEQKIWDIFRYTAELSDILSVEKEFANIENKVLAVCYALISSNNENPGKMANVCDGIRAIFDISKGKTPDVKRIFDMVQDYHNPAHIGITICNKLLG